MASGGKRGGDMVLAGRHLFGIFVLLVVLSGVVFTLGYLLGRSQYDTQIRAAASASAPRDSLASSAAKPAASEAESPAQGDWDLYRSSDPAKSEGAENSGAAGASQAQPAAETSSRRSPAIPRLLASPRIPRGEIVLQVAAVARQSDAVALAQALHQKKFPAFVLAPGADRFYHVQVGPYRDARSANIARQKLEEQGFKSIVKR